MRAASGNAQIDQKESEGRSLRMSKNRLSRPLGVALLAGSSMIAAPALADNCTDLATLTPPDATVTAATMETGAFESPPDGIGVTTKVTETFCRVTGIARSEPTSTIGFELWLPPADKWNGRMLASGGLGTSGAVIYPAMNDALTRGFAALGDDLGHQSSAFASDWAVGHPERVKDWGHRASHFSAVAAQGDRRRLLRQGAGLLLLHRLLAWRRRRARRGAALSGRL